MSQDPKDPSTTTSSPNFETIFTAALKEYKKQTKKDIASHPLSTELKSCDSPNAVLTVLQTQVQTFDPSEAANGRWKRLLDPTVNVLYAFSGFVSSVAGPVSRGIKLLETYALTCVITDIPSCGGNFHWNWSPTPSECLL
jgi:hypothetical protein